MPYVYVTNPAARVTSRSGKLAVMLEGKLAGEWPMDQVDGLMCYGPVSMTGYVMAKLLDEGIPVHMHSMGGRYRGSISAGRRDELFLRMAHHDRWRNSSYRLEMARSLVRNKIRHQGQLLTTVSRRRPEGIPEQIRAVIQSLRLLEDALSSAGNIEQLMGLEGKASRDYFSCFGGLLRSDWSFEGRNRRPPRDPVNALLSFLYVSVGSELVGLLQAAGLDPNLGFLHGFRYGRESLAQDLLEELRQPLVDRCVLRLLNTRQVRPSEFTLTSEDGCRMVPATLKKVVQLYQVVMGNGTDPDSWRARMHRRVNALSDAVLEERIWSSPEGWF